MRKSAGPSVGWSYAPGAYFLTVIVPRACVRSLIAAIHRLLSDSQHLDQGVGDLAARVLLLAGDQPPVADDERLEQAALHVVGAPLPECVLDPPGHHLLPDELVRVVLLDIGEAGNRPTLHEV